MGDDQRVQGHCHGCPPFAEVCALIDGELSSECELEVRWHLDVCRDCVEVAAGVVALKRAVGRAHHRELPFPTLRRTVTAQLRAAAGVLLVADALPSRRRR